jgi:hypothetical protein
MLCLAATAVTACAPRRLEQPLTVLERHRPAAPVLLRHKVRLDIPGILLPGSIDGMMLIEPGNTAPSVRVVGLGGIGITLFDMTVTAEGYAGSFLHPSLARVPHVEEHIARCVRSVWLDSLSLEDLPGEKSGKQTLAEFRSGIAAEYDLVSGTLSAARFRGRNASWSISFYRQRPWPDRIVFSHENPVYTVYILLVESGTETEEHR